MIEIRPIQADQVVEAKRLVITIAQGTYHWPGTIDEVLKAFDKRGELKDMDNIQAHYFDHRGTFFVAMDGGRLVGTGAVRFFSDTVCELKRLWLYEDYQGQGIGYRLITMLFGFARSSGYQTMCLTTDRRQERAITFYQKVGFHFINKDTNDPNDVFMEISL